MIPSLKISSKNTVFSSKWWISDLIPKKSQKFLFRTNFDIYCPRVFRKIAERNSKFQKADFFFSNFLGIKFETNQGVEIVSFFYFCSIKIYQMFLKFILDIDRSPNQNRPSLILDLSRSGRKIFEIYVWRKYIYISPVRLSPSRFKI